MAERGYSSLLWRFLRVAGCPDHGGRLLAGCGHGGQQLPLLAFWPKLGFCPKWGGDLKICQTERLSDPLRQSLTRRWADLSYLVSPQSGQLAEVDLTQMMAEQFSTWRRASQLKAIDVAQGLELAATIIHSIEAGSERSRVRFQWQLEYADLLQISLSDFLTGTLDCPVEPTAEAKMIQQIEQAMALLEQPGQPATQQTVIQMGEGSLRIFSHQPRVRANWDAYQAPRKWQRAAELVNNVQPAIAQLRQQGPQVSRLALCRLVGLSSEALKLYQPAAGAIVDAQSDYAGPSSPPQPQTFHQPRTLYHREDELLRQVEPAIQSLQQQDQPVSQGTLGELLGMAGPGGIFKRSRLNFFQSYDRNPAATRISIQKTSRFGVF